MNNLLNENEKIRGRIVLDGIPISIEYKRGDIQTGTNSETGEEWSREFKVHYGFFDGIRATDGDSLDVFVKPKALKGKPVYVVHNLTPGGDKFDEDKVFMGFDNPHQVKMIWEMHIHKPEIMFGGMCDFTVDEFKEILKTAKTSKGIIAHPEVFYSLKNKGLLSENITSLAFNEYLVSDEESHFVPSDRYPDHPMGRFRQYIGTPLSTDADLVYHGVQENPTSVDNYKTDLDAHHTHEFENLLRIGDYGQNQGPPLEHESDDISSNFYNSDGNIPIDDHKMKELETGIAFDNEIRDSDWVVNDKSEMLSVQLDDIVDYIIDELNNKRVNFYDVSNMFSEIIDFVIEQQSNIFIKFGKSLTNKEMRLVVTQVIKKYIGAQNEDN